MNDSVPKKGIVYIGNLPHGFYEKGLRDYFSQFGEISRLKVKRSDKNAKPMGYAYIEFQHFKVAKVVMNTMNGYLMCNKILKCKLIKGVSNKIFRKNNLKPEFCSGVKHKRRNQFKMERANEETVLKRIEKSKSKLFKILGSKVDSRFLIETSERTNSINCDMKPSAIIEKNSVEKVNDNSDELASTQIEKNSQNKTPKKSNAGHEDTSIGKTPIFMDIVGEDNEIQLKTPPHVTKRFMKASKIVKKFPKRKSVQNMKDKYKRGSVSSSGSKVSSAPNSKSPENRKKAITKKQNRLDKLKETLKNKISNDKNNGKSNKNKFASRRFSSNSIDQSPSKASKKSVALKKTENKMEEHTAKSKKLRYRHIKAQNAKNLKQKDQVIRDISNNQIGNKGRSNKKLASRKFSSNSIDQSSSSSSKKSVALKRKTENKMEEHAVQSKRFKFQYKKNQNVKNLKQKDQVKLLSMKKSKINN